MPRLLSCCLLAAAALCQTLQKPLNNISLVSLSPPSWRDQLLSLHRGLIEIESISGNEYSVGKYLIDYLSGRGYTLDYQVLGPTTDGAKRFNVLAWPVPPSEEGPRTRVLVSSHMDVVPPYIPYSIEKGPVTSKTRISGRGSVDAKASVAAQIVAVEELLAEGKAKGEDLMLLFVVGEETSGDGMKWFSSHMGELSPMPKFEAAIFGEPTENKLACGHKGALHCVLEAKGHSGHSGYPWLGKSANELMVKALSAMLAVDLGSSDEFGNTTINIGLLNGGVAGNVIPEHSTADLMLRVAIGPETTGAKIVEDKIRKIISDIDSEAFTFDCNQGYGFVKTDCDVEGFETITVNYGTDVPGLKGDHTRYLYGPGSILVAHSAQENLTVGDLETAVEGYKKLILHALDASPEL